MHALCVWYITLSAKHIQEQLHQYLILFCHYYNIISMFDPISCFLNFFITIFFSNYTLCGYLCILISDNCQNILTNIYIYIDWKQAETFFSSFFFLQSMVWYITMTGVFVCFSWLISSVMRLESCSNVHHLPPSATSRPPSTKTSPPTPQKVHRSVPNISLQQRCVVV